MQCVLRLSDYILLTDSELFAMHHMFTLSLILHA